MKNKGFTLVEILAVIVILGLLVTFAVPNIIKTAKKSKDNMFENKVGMIEKAAELYIEDNHDSVESGAVKTIKVSDLLEYNYLKKEKKDCEIGTDCIEDIRDGSSMDNKKICLCVIDKRPKAVFIDNSNACNDTVCKNGSNSHMTEDNPTPMKPGSYKLTYDSQGGSSCTQKEGMSGSAWGDLCSPTKTGYTFDGWYTGTNGTGTKVTKDTINNGSLTVYAKWNPNYYYLDLNGVLDGSYESNFGSYGYVDVYINGSLVQSGVTDFFQQYPYGTTYEFRNPRATSSHTYNGVYQGSLSGTIGAGNVTVALQFTTNSTTIYAYTSGSGSVSPSSRTLSYNGSGSYTVTPSTGYYLSNVVCDSGLTASGYSTGSYYTGTTQYVTVTNKSTGYSSRSCTFYFAAKEITVYSYWNSRTKSYPFNNGSMTRWTQELGTAHAWIRTGSSMMTLGLELCEEGDYSCNTSSNYQGKFYPSQYSSFIILADMLDRFRGTNNKWYYGNTSLNSYYCSGADISYVDSYYNSQCVHGYSSYSSYSCNTTGPYSYIKEFRVTPYSSADVVSCNFNFSYGTSEELLDDGGDTLLDDGGDTLLDDGDILWP